jgi:signal transduction histidine kinase
MQDETSHARMGGSELRLSRTLALVHFGGIAALIAVIVASVAYISTEHNALARRESVRLVEGGVASVRLKLETVTKDYSVWDEAYEATITDDRDWLYRNIGTGVTEMGTADMIVLLDPGQGLDVGWLAGSAEEGEPGLLPDSIITQVTDLINPPRASDTVVESAFVNLDGEPWAFAGTNVQPFDQTVPIARGMQMPVQIHGRRISGDLLDEIGAALGIEDLDVVMAPDMPEPSQASLALWGPGVDPGLDPAAEPIAWLVWTPPMPGASILRQIVLPLGIVLVLVAGIAGVSSHYAVRSARRLERALIAARAADRMKTEFLSNVSHELRTPMNGIIGVAQLLQLTDLDAEQGELVAILSSSADMQMSLISDLLDLTKIESGNRALTIERFEPALVLRDIIELVRPQTCGKTLEVGTDLEALDGLAVRGDARAFRQVITNLLANAAKFTDAGRVVLSGRAERREGRVTMHVAVSDTGRGIAEENQRRIFDRFYQVDGSNTRDKGGTGLGLAISDSLARMMGGRIEVQSALGVGSTFTLHLDLEEAQNEGVLRDAA